MQRQNSSFAELFRPGKLIETGGLNFSLGGVVPNTGLAMRKFGCDVFLTGMVGDDILGNIAISQLQKAGAGRGIKRTKSVGTAYGIVIAPPGIDRVFLEDPGCNRVFCADDVDYEYVKNSRLFHFGYPPLMDMMWADDGRQLVDIFERVRKLGTATSLDMALPDPDTPAGQADWKKILANVLPLTDIFVPSIEELLFMLEPQKYLRISEEAAGKDIIDFIPGEEYDNIARKILSLGAKILLIKAGSRGAFLITGDLSGLSSSSLHLSEDFGCPEGIWLSPLPVDAKRFCNASGAGDCAIAGFLAALLKGKTVLDAGKCAMIAGRDNLYGQDALSGLRQWSDLTKQL
jgi:sugar/nucleoside kinase (ribokinase family)